MTRKYAAATILSRSLVASGRAGKRECASEKEGERLLVNLALHKARRNVTRRCCSFFAQIITYEIAAGQREREEREKESAWECEREREKERE